MKSKMLCVLTTFLLFVGFGCSYFSPKPSETIKNFASYLNNQKVGEAANLFSERFISENGGKEKIIEKFKENLSNKKLFDNLTFEIESEVIIVDSALITTQFINDDGKIEKSTYKLIKEGGQWKIDKFL